MCVVAVPRRASGTEYVAVAQGNRVLAVISPVLVGADAAIVSVALASMKARWLADTFAVRELSERPPLFGDHVAAKGQVACPVRKLESSHAVGRALHAVWFPLAGCGCSVGIRWLLTPLPAGVSSGFYASCDGALDTGAIVLGLYAVRGSCILYEDQAQEESGEPRPKPGPRSLHAGACRPRCKGSSSGGS